MSHLKTDIFPANKTILLIDPAYNPGNGARLPETHPGYEPPSWDCAFFFVQGEDGTWSSLQPNAEFAMRNKYWDEICWAVQKNAERR